MPVLLQHRHGRLFTCISFHEPAAHQIFELQVRGKSLTATFGIRKLSYFGLFNV